MIKLSDYVMQTLAKNGVQNVFLLPGGACMHLVDSVQNVPELEFTACLHEQACAFAAEAYGEYGNKLGAALVTAGPGGTNAVTGVAASWLESSPCIFLSGQAKRADMIMARGVRSMGQQELDIISIVKPITKYAVSVIDETTVRFHLEKALYLAKSGRLGPVWLEFPLDVQSSMIDPDAQIGFTPPAPVETPCISDQLKALLAQAKRPVILVGNGVRTGEAQLEFQQFIDRLKIPVLTTWKAADLLPEAHPLYCGRPGGIGQRAANFTQQLADLIIVLGARLDLPSLAFSHQGFSPYAKKVIVDIDENELKKFETDIALPFLGNVRDFLRQAMASIQAADRPEWKDWLNQSKHWAKDYPVVLPEYYKQAEGVSTYAFYDLISDLAQADDVLVPGSSGPCSDIFMQVFRVKKGQRILNAPGLGAMGTGLPGSIGACIASGRKRTLCFNGDGGFQLNIQELETVRRLGLPIKYFIFCNSGYGSIFSMQKGHFKGRYLGTHPESGFTLPDIQRVAEAYGIWTTSISRIDEARSVVESVLAFEGPALCAVTTALDEKTQPRVASSVGPDGRIVSNPLEDMSPQLDREEFSRIVNIAKGGKG